MEIIKYPYTHPARMNTAPYRLASPFTAALILTLLNSVKPLHIDDSAYYQYAAHISAHPLDPYGFEVYWGQRPDLALHILTPPLLPYWWAVGIKLFGERPFLWKLWLLPFCFLFALSLHTLFRRFARGLETPLLWMTVLSPTFLPSLNLMLDIPALGLSLFALTLFLRASDRGSWGLSALAGLLAGLAMLTKYTAMTILPVMLLYAFVFRTVRLGLFAGWVGVTLFACWEGIVAFAYGKSHFVYHFRTLGMLLLHKRAPRLILPLVGILGGLAPALALLALAALGAPPWMILAGAGVGAIGYILLALVPSQHATFILNPATGKAALTLNNLVVGILGLAFWSNLVAVARRVCPPFGRGVKGVDLLRSHPAASFLVLWSALEVLGYFALSPYPAVRRVMGIVIASTVLVGHLASGSCRSRARMLLVHGVLVAAISLGMVYYAVDLIEAMGEKAAVDEVVRHVRRRDTHGTIWYIGLWGFQFHAERAGMKPAIPDVTLLRKGDWLVVPGEKVIQPRIHIDKQRAVISEQLHIVDSVPLSTKPTYYAGRTPIVHHEGARVSVSVYRVNQDFVLASSI